MGLISSILGGLYGKTHFLISVGKDIAAEVILEDKTIIIDINNPILTVEIGARELLFGKKPGEGKNLLEDVHKMGFRLKIRYKRIEFEV